ncbi:hypothetical protein [Pontivivens ytuae]|uniref:Dihydroorotate dehydrogenase n=1 Tax=Pontivivens ytuae TaxID=2789856 RepID=A0A7S9QBP2_9RHOB|nr:hypothetical protein [Pontivivens ytuae]QPH53373.1 hypothetical protein I0K15_16525 [Pontivivens ytuae]
MKREDAMGEGPEHKDNLEAFFAAGRAARPVPDDALMACILGDAAELTPQAAPAPRPRRSAWSRFNGLFGGVAGLATVAASALVGLMIGYAGADDLTLLTRDPEWSIDLGYAETEADYLDLESDV